MYDDYSKKNEDITSFERDKSRSDLGMYTLENVFDYSKIEKENNWEDIEPNPDLHIGIECMLQICNTSIKEDGSIKVFDKPYQIYDVRLYLTSGNQLARLLFWAYGGKDGIQFQVKEEMIDRSPNTQIKSIRVDAMLVKYAGLLYEKGKELGLQ